MEVSMRARASLAALCALALAACTDSLNGSPTTPGAAAGPWVNRTAGTAASTLQGFSWFDLTSDASGTHLVAVTAPNSTSGHGDLWTSADSGVTWTKRTAGDQASTQTWYSVASDSTGAHLVAVTSSTQAGEAREVWTSDDAGVTWTKRTALGGTARYWPHSVASDTTGTRLVLVAGDVWTSADSGLTWTDQTAGGSSQGKLWEVAADATASHLVAMDPGPDDTNPAGTGDLWTSDDAGQTWTNRTQGTSASGQPWRGITSDASGTSFAAVATSPVGIESGVFAPGYGDIWTSGDSGATWTNATRGTAASPQQWTAVASDASGTNLIAASLVDVWRSVDRGATWTNDTGGTVASAQLYTVASDASGDHLFAASNRDLWTRNVP
jgi:hypothetical protein